MIKKMVCHSPNPALHIAAARTGKFPSGTLAAQFLMVILLPREAFSLMLSLYAEGRRRVGLSSRVALYSLILIHIDWGPLNTASRYVEEHGEALQR